MSTYENYAYFSYFHTSLKLFNFLLTFHNHNNFFVKCPKIPYPTKNYSC